MSKLIVGCGFLGRRVLALWRDQGETVLATTRSPDKAGELELLGAVPVLWDVLRPALWASVPVETILYCVGLDRSAGASMREVYVEGLKRALEALPPARRFLYVSSTGVYGQDQGEWVDETSPTEPADESGRVVLEAEQALRASRPEAIILRFAGIYGPGRQIQAEALKRAEPLTGDPDRWLNLIHVEDGARAVLAAEARAAPGGTYIVCDDEPMRRGDYYRELARRLGAPEPRFVPAAPDQPPPRHLRANRRLSNRKMREELGVELRYPNWQVGLGPAG